MLHWLTRDYDRSIEMNQRALELAPDSTFVLLIQSFCLVAARRLDEAEQTIRKFSRLMDRDPAPWVAFIHALDGRASTEEVLPLIEEFDRFYGPFFAATRYAAVGENERARERLEHARDIGDQNYWMFIALEPFLDPLRSEPWFEAMVDELGLDDSMWQTE
jgi:tetratricopeptide (TPR) repeat protein